MEQFLQGLGRIYVSDFMKECGLTVEFFFFLKNYYYLLKIIENLKTLHDHLKIEKKEMFAKIRKQ